MSAKIIKNRNDLLIELLRIADVDERRNTRLFALALAYIISELCPSDRTTGHVADNAWENKHE